MGTALDDHEKQQHVEQAIRLLAEQNIVAAMLAGAVATVVAAAAYGIVVMTWPYFHGFAAAGVGVFVGISVGFLGRGIWIRFAVLASAYTILGCLLGNVFVYAISSARNDRVSLLEAFSSQSASTLLDWAVSGWSQISAVYWLVAIVCAAFLSRRPLSRADRLAIGIYNLRRG